LWSRGSEKQDEKETDRRAIRESLLQVDEPFDGGDMSLAPLDEILPLRFVMGQSDGERSTHQDKLRHLNRPARS